MLSIVSTPIGNLRDITLRALEMLEKCDGIICEDTRVTGHLLSLLKLPKKPLISLHSYSDPGKLTHILDQLATGKHFCLVSDAGTPCISDPGYALVSKVRSEGLPIEVLPGASAFLAALSASGLPINQFTYLGFLPVKKGRQTLLQSLLEEERTVVFYESPHRILRTLADLEKTFGEQPDRKVVIARELTKIHEEVISTTIVNLGVVKFSLTVKGEFVVVVGGK